MQLYVLAVLAVVVCSAAGSSQNGPVLKALTAEQAAEERVVEAQAPRDGALVRNKRGLLLLKKKLLLGAAGLGALKIGAVGIGGLALAKTKFGGYGGSYGHSYGGGGYSSGGYSSGGYSSGGYSSGGYSSGGYGGHGGGYGKW